MGRLESIKIHRADPNEDLVVLAGTTKRSIRFKYGQYGEYFTGQATLYVYADSTSSDENFTLKLVHIPSNMIDGDADPSFNIFPRESIGGTLVADGSVHKIDLYDTGKMKVCDGYAIDYVNGGSEDHTVRMKIVMK